MTTQLILPNQAPTPEIQGAVEHLLRMIFKQNPRLVSAIAPGFSISINTRAGLAFQMTGGLQPITPATAAQFPPVNGGH